jgi:hypothetical protein
MFEQLLGEDPREHAYYGHVGGCKLPAEPQPFHRALGSAAALEHAGVFV